MPDSNQALLFQKIRAKTPEPDFAGTIAEVLNISLDSAYRRIRCETPLVLDEVKALSERFGISLDAILQLKQEDILFRSIRIDPQTYNYETYLSDILGQLQRVGATPAGQLYYVAKDLPLFHNFYFEPLIAFRYFFWNKTLMKHPEFEGREFTLDCVPAHITEMSRAVASAYATVSGTEVWNTECVNTALMQIGFYKDSGYFSSVSDARQVYQALEETISHIKKQAEKGTRFLPGQANPGAAFNFFFNRVLLGDNIIYVSAEKQQTVYLNYHLLNYLVTRDEDFCKQCFDDIQNVIRRSTMISQTGEKHRNVFFSILQSRISERIKSLQ